MVGGGEVLTSELLKRWNSQGIILKSLETSPSPSTLAGASYPVFAVPLPFQAHGFIDSLIIIPILMLGFIKRALYVRHSINVVFAPTSNFSDLAPAWFVSKLLRRPLICSFLIASYAPSLYAIYKLMRTTRDKTFESLLMTFSSLLVLKLARSASVIFCLSPPIFELLVRLGFLRDRLYITGAGVDHQLIGSIRDEEKRHDGVFLGRVEKSKGVVDLIQAWRIVVRERPTAKLLIVGAGGFLNDAKRLVKEIDLTENVEFVGYIATAEKFSYIKRGRVFIYPSKMEGWGLSVSEAMACGLPVVCYDIPTFRRVFGECRSVILVRPWEVGELSKAILSLLQDEKLLVELSKASKRYSEKYSWDNVAREMLEIIKNACHNKNMG